MGQRTLTGVLTRRIPESVLLGSRDECGSFSASRIPGPDERAIPASRGAVLACRVPAIAHVTDSAELPLKPFGLLPKFRWPRDDDWRTSTLQIHPACAVGGTGIIKLRIRSVVLEPGHQFPGLIHEAVHRDQVFGAYTTPYLRSLLLAVVER
jgi:hypothetical protein